MKETDLSHLEFDQAFETNIIGLKIYKKRIIRDDRGFVMHMIRAELPIFNGLFGEVYFSQVRPDVTKGWKLHREFIQRLQVIQGKIKFEFVDSRESLALTASKFEIEVSSEQPVLIIIPPNVWYSFKNIGVDNALIANCASHPFRQGESCTSDYIKGVEPKFQ
jgi:dTDP-4-dehydrorhamnose 3,5-epimerase